ncbi:MAG: substrate-binding domain-containing protein [Lachnospiraceae bacterium]|nr:substrate-binding domain-containing protein [Lachnospiraceae bacterium]
MRKYKWIVAMLVVIALLTMTACTGETGINGNDTNGAATETNAGTETDDNDDTSVVTGGSLANTPGGKVMGGMLVPYVGALLALPYFIDHRVGLERAGIVFGNNTTVVGPSEYDMHALMSALEQQIPLNPAAIFVSAFEDTVRPAIEQAFNAGLPVFTIDMDLTENIGQVFLGGDTYDFGRISARAMAEALDGEGYILLQYNIGQNSQDQRASGFREEVETNFPGITIVQEIGSETDISQDVSAFQAALQANPNVNGIATLVSTGAVAAATAVRELNRMGEVMIIGDSKDDPTLALVENGEVYATVTIKTITETWYATMLLDGLIRGNVSISSDDEAAGITPLPTFVDIGTFVITQETAAYFYQPDDPFDHSNFVIEDPSEDDVFYLIGALLELPYFIDHRIGFEAAVAELGVTGRFIGPLGYDMTAQAQMIDEAIAQNPRAILVMGFDDTLAPAINRAEAAGIPVVTIDMDTNESDRRFFVGGNNYEFGRLQAATLAEGLNGAGDILLNFNMGQNSQEERAQGFRDELEENWPGITIVQEVGSETDVSRDVDAFRAALQANPSVVGIGTLVSTGAVASATAVRELNRSGEVFIVGDSKDDATLSLIESGEVYATIANKTRIAPYIAMRILYLYLYTNMQVSLDDAAADVSVLPTFVDIGSFVITQDTAQYFFME